MYNKNVVSILEVSFSHSKVKMIRWLLKQVFNSSAIHRPVYNIRRLLWSLKHYVSTSIVKYFLSIISNAGTKLKPKFQLSSNQPAPPP